MCLLVTTTNRVSDLSVHPLHHYVSFLNPIDRCPFMSLSLIRNQTAKLPLNPLFSLRSELSVWDFKSILFWLYILLSKTNIGSVISGRLIDLSTTMSDFSETEVRFTNKEGRFFIFAYFSSLLKKIYRNGRLTLSYLILFNKKKKGRIFSAFSLRWKILTGGGGQIKMFKYA